ncbi:GNAT family N-acetyltransferase [Acinetobacter gerneri]|jgi:GNAT superfamily N-acetyltransferase|uniref:GNAT family N-acetyltransferase n=1 Tax=Acinetobacter gerneri TaxID=202952 RepID=UPI0023EF5987|nr:GNAT family N-acetyltransferase [Acinetobacter gerneri]MCH4245107.1 GNAT family N-acetyltransferase [Acinetobacter gerneri]
MEKIYTWQKDHFLISTDPDLLDVNLIYEVLTKSKWAKGISAEKVEISIQHSLCFGLYQNHIQIGFARYITDYVTFAYLCDVFILDQFQKTGLGKWLMESSLEHPDLKKLRRIMLVTSTAAWLYEKVGYVAQNKDNFVWEIFRPDIYNE